MHIDFTGAAPDAIARAIAGASHLQAPLRAMRDHGCRFLFTAQSRERFDVPSDRPAIVVIGDDMSVALGPSGFHEASLRRFLARCPGVVIVACEPLPQAYALACNNAVEHRFDVAIIETRPEREADWYDFLREVRPDVSVVIATVKPEGSA